MDYFTLFGLPAQYPIDLQALTVRFQDLQRQYHPDKFASGTQAEQLAAVSHSATINQPGKRCVIRWRVQNICSRFTVSIWRANSIPCATPPF
ncbi:Chaperone protein HscB [Enterobacter hormaechei]|nr:Chaperone protein HscB [Enterobacter hormaechei]